MRQWKLPCVLSRAAQTEGPVRQSLNSFSSQSPGWRACGSRAPGVSSRSPWLRVEGVYSFLDAPAAKGRPRWRVLQPWCWLFASFSMWTWRGRTAGEVRDTEAEAGVLQSNGDSVQDEVLISLSHKPVAKHGVVTLQSAGPESIMGFPG